MSRHLVTWRRETMALMFWSSSLARDAACHFDANLPKPTSCQIAAKTVKGFWTALSEVMQCQTSSYNDSTCAEVCFWYCVKVLRHSHLYIVPFCRTCGRTGNNAILVVFLHRGGRQQSQLLTHTNVVTLEEPHLLSPSNDTRRHCQESAELMSLRVRLRRDAKRTRVSMPRPFKCKSLPRTLPATD